MSAIVAPLVEHDFTESRSDHRAKRDEDEEQVRVDDVDPFGHERSSDDDIANEQPAHEEQRVPREFALAEDEHHGIGSPMNGVHGAVTLDRAAERAAFLADRWQDSRSPHDRAAPPRLSAFERRLGRRDLPRGKALEEAVGVVSNGSTRSAVPISPRSRNQHPMRQAEA